MVRSIAEGSEFSVTWQHLQDLSWKLKKKISKRYLLFQGFIFSKVTPEFSIYSFFLYEIDSQLDPPWCGCCRRHSNHSNDLQRSEQEDHVHQWHWTTSLTKAIIFKKRTHCQSLKSWKSTSKMKGGWSTTYLEWDSSWRNKIGILDLDQEFFKAFFCDQQRDSKNPFVVSASFPLQNAWQFANWPLPSHCHNKPWRWSECGNNEMDEIMIRLMQENPANQLRPGSLSTVIYRVLYIPGGCLGFLPSTVCWKAERFFQIWIAA